MLLVLYMAENEPGRGTERRCGACRKPRFSGELPCVELVPPAAPEVLESPLAPKE